MRRPARLSGLALGGALCAIAAAVAFAEGRPAGTTASKTRLSNGLTLLVRVNPAAPVVAVSLFIRGGARAESEADAGAGHLLHQVMLKGTASRSAIEIAEAAEAMGGSVSASSDADFFEVRGSALARRWRGLLDLIADVALRPSLPPDEIEGERRLILSAMRNRLDQPFPLALDTVMSRLYGSHPYGRPSLGRAAVVERLDRSALLAHHRRHYRAERMIVSVSGDVEQPDVVAAAGRLFGGASPGDGGPDVPPSSPAAALDRTAVARPSAQAQVLMGFLAPPVSHPDYTAVKVLSTALGGGMAGRLFTELRDKQGLAYSTTASYPTRVGPSFLLAQVGTAPANAGRAEEEVKRQIERLRREPMREEELQRAKSYLRGQFALDRRTNARLAWYGAFFEAAGVGHDFPERYVEAVGRVTAADVQRVAQSYLASPTIVSLGPPPR